jgi:tetratricopeptide (TPR) repeat protein
MSLARLQVAANRIDDAEQTFKQLSALPEKAYKPLHAIFLYQTGKKAAAMAEFEKLAKDDPEDRAARSRLVSIYFEMNKIPEAQALLASALKRNPKDSDALFQRSELMLKLGKLSEADEDLKRVLRLQPDSAEAHYAAAAVYRAQGSKEMAKQELDSVLRLKPSFLQARLALARTYLLANQSKAALDLLEAAPASQKGTLGFVIERNWALLEAGETKEVQKILDRALQVGRVPELLFQESILRMQEHDYQGARLDAEEVLKSRPEDTRAVRIVVDTYVAQKDVPKATERLTEIVAARPNSGPLQQMLGLWYRSIGNLAESRIALEKAKIDDPKLLTADLALAGIDRQENHFDAARQRLAGVIKTAPKNVPALLESANVELEAGNREGAISRYRTVLDADSSNLMALNNLAYILALDNTDEALKLAQKATEIAPDSPAVQDTIGFVYYRRGNYLTAVNYFKTAVAKEPTPRRQFHLAMSYLKSGDQNLGQKMLEAALEKDPSLPKTEHGW